MYNLGQGNLVKICRNTSHLLITANCFLFSQAWTSYFLFLYGASPSVRHSAQCLADCMWKWKVVTNQKEVWGKHRDYSSQHYIGNAVGNKFPRDSMNNMFKWFSKFLLFKLITIAVRGFTTTVFILAYISILISSFITLRFIRWLY